MTTIISGGQTGVDTLALLAARDLGLPTGGTVPHFCKTVGGLPIAALGLVADAPAKSAAQAYARRSMQNVDAADVTVALRWKSSPGTDKTIGYCRTGRWQVGGTGEYRPVLVVDPRTDGAAEAIVDFIRTHKARRVNVCGHRDATDEAAGVLATAFAELGAKRRKLE